MFLFIRLFVCVCVCELNVYACVCERACFSFAYVCVCVYVRVHVRPVCVDWQAWRPSWGLWSSLWRSCRTWWSWPSSVLASLLWLDCSSSWEICGKNACSGQSTWRSSTWLMVRSRSTGENTSWTTVSQWNALTLCRTWFVTQTKILPETDQGILILRRNKVFWI